VLGVKDMIYTAIVDTLVPREGMISRCSFKIKLEDRRRTTKASETNFYSRRSERERKTRSNSTATTITTM
jgi:hypothetical protein